MKPRKSDSHKGDNGKVLVVGGSIDYVGAVYLAGMAAFRAGVDNVTIVAPEKVAWAINCLSPDFITVKVRGSYFTAAAADKILQLSKNFDVVLIGNGLGTRAATKKFAASVVKKIKKPKVIDADAIKAVKIQDVSNAILTPHKKEFEILLKNSGCSEKNVKAEMGNNVIIVKGMVDKIFSKNKTKLNRTGHAGMTVAGTGDVLAGITAGILAQEKDLWAAACIATYVNGKIGEKLSKRFGYGYTASDMLDLIGKEVENG
ncbi:NAD(P)H-hydrate dehydratase [Candidatus Woesearchaeota archaeon]|nr:NAD(P)H-hydrate dehydratase [Candidatus Woesearchaeota archaeon]